MGVSIVNLFPGVVKVEAGSKTYVIIALLVLAREPIFGDQMGNVAVIY